MLIHALSSKAQTEALHHLPMACHLDAVDETGMKKGAARRRIQTHDAPDLPHKVRLSPRWPELVSEFQTLGEVKAVESRAKLSH